MTTGRPPKYKSKKDLQVKIDEYFVKVKEENETHPTITGLVLHCGYADRKSFYDLENQTEFSHTVKVARTRIEEVYESHLMKPGAGPIFALKNFGWRDVQETKISGEMTTNTVDLSKLNDKELADYKKLREKME